MKQELTGVFNSVGCSKEEQSSQADVLRSSCGDLWRQGDTSSGLKVHLRLLKRDVSPFHPAGESIDSRKWRRGPELRLVEPSGTTMAKQLRKQSRNRRGTEFDLDPPPQDRSQAKEAT